MLMKEHIAQDENYQYIPISDNEKHFYTHDFEFAVTLLCKGYELVTIDSEQEERMTFIFEDDENILKIFDDFWANKITVNPLEFTNVRKNLKSRIYGMKKGY